MKSNFPLQPFQSVTLLLSTIGISALAVTSVVAQVEVQTPTQTPLRTLQQITGKEPSNPQKPGVSESGTPETPGQASDLQNPAIPENSMPGATNESSEPQTPSVPETSTPGTTDPQMPSTEPSSSATGDNLVAVAAKNEQFTTLVKALEAANLQTALAEEGPYTLFAPTDAAFDQLPDAVVEALLKPENQDLLKQVLSYHVVPGKLTSEQLKTGTVNSLDGGLAVKVTQAGVVVNDATVIQPDIEASNGVIHGINRVLIPEEVRSSLMKQLQGQQ